MDWLETLHRIRAIKLDLARIDPRGGMPIAPPPGAPEAAIAGVERRLGFRLPPSYRALLALHDGWPQLFAGASLLGVRALSRGSFVDVARMVIGDVDLDEPGTEVTEIPTRAAASTRPQGWRNTLVPFGIDEAAETIFAWDVEEARPDGELGIILWTNEIAVRADSFAELLDLVGEMLAAELDDRRRLAAALDLTPRVPTVAPSRSRARPVSVTVVAAPAATRPVARTLAG